MKITDVRSTVLRLPVVQPSGDGLQDMLIIEVDTDEGITGVGEAHTSPFVVKSIIEAPVSQLTSQGLKHLLIGEDPRNIQYLWNQMYSHTTTYGRRGVVINAISGIDIALWDIAGKLAELPISTLLGGASHVSIPCYASDLMPEDDAALITRIEEHKERGFAAMKFGWGPLGQDLRADTRRMQIARENAGVSTELMFDFGVPIELHGAVRLTQEVAELNIRFIEEPLGPDDLAGYAELCRTSPVPIATGEKETTRFGFRELIDVGKLRIVQPDIARCGGLTEVVRIANYADLRGVSVIPHCWGSDILVSATAQFLSTLQRPSFLEYNVAQNPLRTELTTAPLAPIQGKLTVPSSPGLGIDLNPDTVGRYACG